MFKGSFCLFQIPRHNAKPTNNRHILPKPNQLIFGHQTWKPTTQITKINIRFGSTDSSSRHVLRLNFDVHVVLHLFYNFVQSANAIKMESHFTSAAVARLPHYTRHTGVNKNLKEHSYFNAHAFSRNIFALFELLLYDNQINL